MTTLSQISPELAIISNLGIADANHLDEFKSKLYECREALTKYTYNHQFTKTQLTSLNIQDLHNICRVISLNGWWYKNKAEIVRELIALQ